MFRSTMTATGLVAALILAVPGQASAATTVVFLDGFENNPGANWTFEENGGYGDFEPHDGIAHTGRTYAELWRFDTGWTSVDRTAKLPYPRAAKRTCFVNAYVHEAAGTRFNIEVIDPGSWTYVTLAKFTLDGSLWPGFAVSWPGGPDTVVLRFVVASDGGFARIKVDDVKLGCRDS